MGSNDLVPKGGNILIYQSEAGLTKIEVRLEGETLWLSQAGLAQLYQTTIPNINIHIKNIYDEQELVPEATVKDYLIVQTEGDRRISRQVKHYNNSAGRISHEMAKQLAENEYDEFNKKRIEWKDKQDSDFDKTVKMIEEEKKHKKPRLKADADDKKPEN